MKKLLTVLFLLFPVLLHAQIITTPLPVTLTNGTLADANQVMSNFNAITTGVNTNGAKNGANSDITSLSALTTPITPAQGGSNVFIGVGSGTSGAMLVVTPTPTGFTLISGYTVNFIPSVTSSGPVTLSVAGTTATPVLRQTSTGLQPLVSGEIFINQMATVIYDGTQFELINSASTANVQPCTTIDYDGTTVPTGYLATDGSAQSRVTFATLFSCLSRTGIAATLNGTTTVTVPNSALFQVGWFVGGSNITCNSTIQSIPGGGTTIVINNSAGASGSSTLTIGPYSQGDCSTTFNLPNHQGRLTAMVDTAGGTLSSTACPNPASIGSKCGSTTQTIALANLPTGITSPVTVTVVGGSIPGGSFPVANTTISGISFNSGTADTAPAFSAGAGVWAPYASLGGTATSNNTSGTAFLLQPVGLVTKAIKF